MLSIAPAHLLGVLLFISLNNLPNNNNKNVLFSFFLTCKEMQLWESTVSLSPSSTSNTEPPSLLEEIFELVDTDHYT